MSEICKKWLALLGKPFVRLILFILTCLAFGAALYLLFRINQSNVALPLACSFYRFTGLYCPGCGMTRAFFSVIRGNIPDAFSYNLLWPFITLLAALPVYFWFCFLYSGKNPFNPVNRFLQRHSFLGWFVLVLFFSFWVLRNIPVYPFTLLAPG